MSNELKKYLEEIVEALNDVANKTSTLLDGDIKKNASNFKLMLSEIKSELIEKALELCQPGEYEPKHILNKTSRNLWAMNIVFLNIMETITNTTPTKESMEYLKSWIKRYAIEIKLILNENS